jgi:hypothetical protein
MPKSNKGVILKVNGTSTGSLINLSMPEIDNPAVEATNHDSVAVEMVSGRLPKVGEMVMTVDLDKTQTITYYNYLTAGSMLAWNVAFPVASGSLVFNGILTKLKIADADANAPELLKADFTVVPSGSLAFI